jgi:hypothetical protein
MQTQNKAEFVEAWTKEIRTLYGLCHTATQEQSSKVVVHIHELEDLVKEISEELSK